MRRLSTLFVEAASGGVTSSFDEILLFSEFRPYADDPLAAMGFLIDEAIAHGIEIVPKPSSVGPRDPLVFRRIDTNSIDAIGARIVRLVQEGELPQIELKSTLWLDINRRRSDAKATVDQLKSLKVCHSAMKTLCGFLNEDGGSLVIGISDDRSILGIEQEYPIACPKEQSVDGWLKAFRGAVTQFFHEPDQILHHVRLQAGRHDGMTMILAEVTPRRKLTFCKCSELRQFGIYTRRGSSTENVDILAIEQFIEARKARLGIVP